MQELDDSALLREYVERDSEEAFAALVTRHVNKVYSVALRLTGNPHSAEEITQAVFVILARKSRQLGKRVILSGWLYQTARLTAVTFIRGGIRRARREQEAYMQTALNENESDAWVQIAPLLDAAMAGLNETDRHAVVLRFFDGKSLREVGAVLGANEEAAKKRVSRALEKLRAFFAKRGVSSTTAIIAGAISGNSVQAAPAALAKSVTAIAVAKGATAGGSTLTLIKGALKIMAWTKAKMAIVVGVGVIFAAGTTTVTIKEIQNYKGGGYSWQVENATPEMLDKLPPLIKIVPTKIPNKNTSRLVSLSVPELNRFKALGIRMQIQDVLRTAYQKPGHEHDLIRIVAPTRILSSPARYDFIVTLPSGGLEALQHEITKKLGLVGRNETIVTNVLLLKVKYPDSPGLKSSTVESEISPRQAPGEISFVDDGFRILAGCLESNFKMPVLDETGLTNRHYYDLKWNQPNWQKQNLNGLKQALLDQLGLELVPGSEPIKMLVVEKVK
jgi:uncharacterized protein (TIGR03435 family)